MQNHSIESQPVYLKSALEDGLGKAVETTLATFIGTAPGHWYGKRDPSNVNNAQIDDVLRTSPELQQLISKLLELNRRPKSSSQMYTKYDDDYPDGDDVSDTTKSGPPSWKRVADEMARDGWLLRGHPSMRKKRAAERDPIWRPW
ncbi:hypothetical protein Bbelb_189610 [Branchiostoma belcheri]|nr:hypothetical protein Bbelb_189610 [Branchiostoma belcheri]